MSHLLVLFCFLVVVDSIRLFGECFRPTLTAEEKPDEEAEAAIKELMDEANLMAEVTGLFVVEMKGE